MSDAPKPLTCSFCAKEQKAVTFLIAGLENIFICDECVQLCMDISFDRFRMGSVYNLTKARADT